MKKSNNTDADDPLQFSARQLKSILQTLAEGLITVDTEGNVIFCNEAAQEILNVSQVEILGQSLGRFDWHQVDQRGVLYFIDEFPLSTALRERRVVSNVELGVILSNGEGKYLSLNAAPLFDESGVLVGGVASFRNITDRKNDEAAIHNLAFYDTLTRLPNRRLLMERLQSDLAASARSHYFGAVLFLDMDKFKVLNDTMGHNYGDLLLVEVALRIQSCVRDVDTVARLGGDEFVVLLENVGAQPESASRRVAKIAEKIRKALSKPYLLREAEFLSSPSIGVSLYSGDTETPDALLKHADVAMYQVKASGRNAVRFFDPAMQQTVETRNALETDLRHAISANQLQLYYQIQMDSDHRPIGAEALCRWIHPTRGFVPPSEFIPIAEEGSLIIQIGDWVLQTACKQLELWAKNERTKHLTLAVNVSSKQFKQADFVEKVVSIIQSVAINPARLKLELTESEMVADITDVIWKMHALRVSNIKLSLDDFGTGYSSLSYLKQLPLDQLKIDQSFVRDMTFDQNDAVMVKTIIDLAKNFQLNVIAEGVETESQLALLKQLGCMAYQGYYFSKPVPIEQFEKLLD